MLVFYGLSGALNPIKILLKMWPSGSDVLKLIFLSAIGTLNRTFFEPFLFAYQSLILSGRLVVALNFSMKSTSFAFHETSFTDIVDLVVKAANDSKILLSISLFSPETKIFESDWGLMLLPSNWETPSLIWLM